VFSSSLVGQGGLAFFAATVLSNGANFTFHVVMSRLLGPSAYGALGSILGLSIVVTLATTAFQAAVTQAVAESGALSIARSMRRAALVAVVVLGLTAAISPLVEGFLHLASPVPVVLFGVFAATSVVAVVPQGCLIGRLRFTAVAGALVAGAAARLGSGVLLVHWGWGLNGAVAATAVNGVVALAVLLWPLRSELSFRHPVAQLRLRIGSSALAVAALGGVSAFVGVDTFLARHFLTGPASGEYVAAATAARIALFLPAAVAWLVFPRLVAEGGRSDEARRLLRHAAAAVALLGGATAAVLAAVPGTVIDVLFGARYAGAAPALRVLAVAAAAVGLVTVFVYALLARRSLWCVVSWIATAAAAVLITVVHSGSPAIAWVMLGLSAALVLVTSPALVQRRRRSAGER